MEELSGPTEVERSGPSSSSSSLVVVDFLCKFPVVEMVVTPLVKVYGDKRVECCCVYFHHLFGRPPFFSILPLRHRHDPHAPSFSRFLRFCPPLPNPSLRTTPPAESDEFHEVFGPMSPSRRGGSLPRAVRSSPPLSLLLPPNQNLHSPQQPNETPPISTHPVFSIQNVHHPQERRQDAPRTSDVCSLSLTGRMSPAGRESSSRSDARSLP